MIVLLLVVVVIGTEVRGSQRWLDIGFYRFQPSEFSKLLLVLFLAAFLADRGKRVGETTDGRGRGRASLRSRRCSSSCSRTSAPRSCTRRRSRPSLFFAGARWLHLAVLAAIGACVVAFVLWLGPAAGIQILKPYQTARLTAFANPENDPGRCRLQRRPVDHRRRRRRHPRARRRARDPDQPRLPARACDRLRLRLARRAARLRRRVDLAPALPARDLARDQDRRRGAGRLLGDRGRRRSRSCSCSRSSSTWA